MANKPHVDEATLRVMRKLVRQPPKPHDQMKLGKPKGKKATPPRKPKAKPPR
jgi:hypothetical protein